MGTPYGQQLAAEMCAGYASKVVLCQLAAFVRPPDHTNAAAAFTVIWSTAEQSRGLR